MTTPLTCREPGCGSTVALSPDGFCVNHDVARRAAVEAGRAKGGAVTGARAAKSRTITLDELASWGPLEGLEDVARWQGKVAQRVATGDFDARTGDVVSYALANMGRTLEKVAEMDRRLKAAQAEIERLRAKMEQERP